MYIQSRYNVKIEKNDENTLVYNAYTTSIAFVPNYYLEDVVYIYDDNVKTLLEQGILIESSKDELKEMESFLEKNKNTKMDYLSITIAPTYLCNMRCPYCFQEEEERVMDLNLANIICESIQIISKGYGHINITWFGGEPLLATDIIEYISKKMIAYCDEKNIYFSANIITNGSLLNKSISKKLIECHIKQIQITLDGINHDEIRKMKNGEKSYQNIKKNIIENVDNFKIVIRSNITESNVADVEKMIEELMQEKKLLGKVTFSFYPVSDFKNKCSKDSFYCEYCDLQNFGDLLVRLSKKVLDYETIDEITNFSLKTTFTPCEAVIRETVCFDANGDVYKCALAMQNENMKIGNLYSQKISKILDDDANSKWMDFKWDEECKECMYLPMCHSGCIYKIKTSNKRHNCCNEKYYCSKIVKVIYESYKRQLNI